MPPGIKKDDIVTSPSRDVGSFTFDVTPAEKFRRGSKMVHPELLFTVKLDITNLKKQFPSGLGGTLHIRAQPGGPRSRKVTLFSATFSPPITDQENGNFVCEFKKYVKLNAGNPPSFFYEAIENGPDKFSVTAEINSAKFWVA